MSIIVGSITLNTAVPLLYELSCELAYPTGEATSNGIMTIANNFVGLIFLFVLMDPNVGTYTYLKPGGGIPLIFGSFIVVNLSCSYK